MDSYTNGASGTSTKSHWRTRAASEERPTTIKAFESQGTPLIGRKCKQVMIRKFTANLQSNQVYEQKTEPPGLYDRKLNRSFEKPEGLIRRNSKESSNIASTHLRRSSPHLATDEYLSDDHFRNSISPMWCCGVMKQLRKMNFQY